MLTVKVVSPNKNEQLHEAARVWTEDHQAQEAGAGKRVVVCIETPHGDTRRFDPTDLGDRTVVFVMNDAGQTIGRYDLQTRPAAYRYPPAPTAMELEVASRSRQG